MSQKRQQDEEGTSFGDGRSRRLSPSFRRLRLGLMDQQGLQNQIMTRFVESCIRPVVREEAESAVRRYTISVERKDILPFGSRSLRLQFLNAVSLPVFTGTPIQGGGGAAIEVALVDEPTGQVVSSGPWSSAKVGIVVLEGDFGGNEGENWTLEEFKRKIVKQREGKSPLLTGDVILTLKNGKGFVGNVSFTDNSRWIRSQKFRLGARLMDDIDGIRVKEARSEPFTVRNIVRPSLKKHDHPALSDEVWRLKNIGKDGAFHKRLSTERVNSVQDFHILLASDPRRLRKIIGTSMSNKKWEATVRHAWTCVPNKTLYLYNDSTTPQTNAVIFNVVQEVMAMFKDGQYVATDKLSEAEKEHARALVMSAREHPNKILTLNDETSLNPPPKSLPASTTDHQHLSSHNIARSTYSQPHNASSLDPLLGFPSFDSDFRHNLDATSYDQFFSFPNQEDALILDQYFNFSVAECLNYSEADGAIDPFIPRSVVPVDKDHKGWNILASMLRCRLSIKRIAARKRESRL